MKSFPLAACLILFAFISACTPGRSPSPTLPPPPPPPAATPTSPLPSTSTATPADTPTPLPTSTATPVPNGPCDNPLVPVGAASQWIYRVTTLNGSSQFSLTSLAAPAGVKNGAQVEYTDQKNNYTVRSPVTCLDGVILNYPLFVVNMLLSGYLEKYISATQVSGKYSPDYQSLVQNNYVMNWNVRYITRDAITIGNPWGLAALYIPANTPMDLLFALNNLWEPVTVPAGTFPQALKSSMTLSLPVTDGTMLIGISQWSDPYLGLVRAQINAVLHGRNTLPIQSMLELVSFTPGK